MSYAAYAQPARASFDIRLTGFGPTARLIGEGLSWLGGGVLFAAIVYMMAALPGFMG